MALETVTVHDGRFEVRATPADIPRRYIDEDGIINLHVMALSNDGEVWSEHVPAKAAAVNGSPVWIDSLSHEPPGAGFATSSRAGALSGVSIGSLSRLGARPARPSARTARGPICSDRVTSRYRANAHAAASYPVGRDRSWFSVQSSNGGRYGVAEKQPGQRVQRAGTQHAPGGWAWAARRRKATRAYLINVGYVAIEHRYRDTAGYCQYYFTYEPTVETGGTRTKGISRPTRWRETCVGVSPGRWSRLRSDGSPYSLSWGVGTAGFLGINLSVSKQYSRRGHKVVYNVHGRKKMCGKGQAPAVAPDVLERRR